MSNFDTQTNSHQIKIGSITWYAKEMNNADNTSDIDAIKFTANAYKIIQNEYLKHKNQQKETIQNSQNNYVPTGKEIEQDVNNGLYRGFVERNEEKYKSKKDIER